MAVPIYQGPRVGTDRRPLGRYADEHRRPWRVIAWYAGEEPRTLAHAPTVEAAEHTAAACAGRENLVGGERERMRISCSDGQQISWEAE